MSSRKKIKEGYTSLNNQLFRDEDLPVWYADYYQNQLKAKRENYKSFTIKLNKESDAELISFLQDQKSITECIRKLIKKEMDEK